MAWSWSSKKGLDDAMGGVGNSPSTTKMAELKQSNGKLGWDWYLLILRVIPEARAILNEGHKDIESVR